jgi:hypothetical protein
MPTVRYRGPLFDGRAEKVTAEATRDIEKTVATLGASMVRTELQHVLKTQTPYYRLRVTAQPTNPHWKIWDQRVIYGNWLEGTGSRNYPKTRFRGYATFRRITQVINARAKDMANGVLAKYMGRLS